MLSCLPFRRLHLLSPGFKRLRFYPAHFRRHPRPMTTTSSSAETTSSSQLSTQLHHRFFVSQHCSTSQSRSPLSIGSVSPDDKVTVLESEKRAWESSPEAQAIKEALNPWRNHPAEATKDT